MADETISELVREWQGGMSQRQLAQKMGVHQTTVHDFLLDHQPTLPIALKVANNLKLAPAVRARWFRACGLEDPQAPPGVAAALESLLEAAEEQPEELTYEPDLEQLEVRAYGGGEISDRDREVLERIIRAVRSEQRKRHI